MKKDGKEEENDGDDQVDDEVEEIEIPFTNFLIR